MCSSSFKSYAFIQQPTRIIFVYFRKWILSCVYRGIYKVSEMRFLRRTFLSNTDSFLRSNSIVHLELILSRSQPQMPSKRLLWSTVYNIYKKRLLPKMPTFRCIVWWFLTQQILVLIFYMLKRRRRTKVKL